MNLPNPLEVTIMVLVSLLLLLPLLWWVSQEAEGAEIPLAYTNEQIADAIYKAEGADEATYPYGIRSVSCEGLTECRQVCLNTIRNNRKRYADYGCEQYSDFITFLGSRYAPINAPNDPLGLNSNWVKNVKFFLKKGAK